MAERPEQMDATFPAVRDFLDLYVLGMIEGHGSMARDGEWFFSLGWFTNEWVTRDMARAICRGLTDRGLCHWRRGLFTEDGEVAGSGYGITREGIEYYRSKGESGAAG